MTSLARSPLLLFAALLLTEPLASASAPPRGTAASYQSMPSTEPLVGIFDDGAHTGFLTLALTYLVTDVSGDVATVQGQVTMDVAALQPGVLGGTITYFGADVVDAADRSDWSFIHDFQPTQAQLANALIVHPDANGTSVPDVEIPGPFHVIKNFTARVDATTGLAAIDGDPRPFVWTLWIDPSGIGPGSGRDAPLSLDWNVSGHMSYGAPGYSAGEDRIVATFAPTASAWIQWNHDLVRLPSKEAKAASVPAHPSNVYDAQTGFLLGTMGDYVDDLMHRELGLEIYSGKPAQLFVMSHSTLGALAEQPRQEARGAPAPAISLAILGVVVAALLGRRSRT